MAWWKILHLTGLAFCVVGVAIIFLFCYPPKEEERQALFTPLVEAGPSFGVLRLLTAVGSSGR
jgi:hypothetical protein